MNDQTTQSPTKKDKVAVLLYGYLRTFEQTAPSLFKHIIVPHDADIFYFGPQETDKPSLQHGRVVGAFNPKNYTDQTKEDVDLKAAFHCYGGALKDYRFDTEPASAFATLAESCPREEWLYSLNPARFFSMAFNMTRAYQLMEAYERENNIRYDKVILTRPDLCFYAPLELTTVCPGTLQIPEGSGFDVDLGRRSMGNAPVMFYKNITTGEVLELGLSFNDQVLIFCRQDADLINTLFDEIRNYVNIRVPLTPETMLYFHFCKRGGLKLQQNKSIFYEIVRFNQQCIMNICDIQSLERYDPNHKNIKSGTISSPQKKHFIRANLRKLIKILLHPFIPDIVSFVRLIKERL